MQADKLEIHQSTIYYAELLGQWDKRIVDQESDIPSIIIFYTFYRLRALKSLYFYLCNFIKKIRKSIEMKLLNSCNLRFASNTSLYVANQTLWNIRLLVDNLFVPSSKQPSVIYCRLTDF